MAEENPIKEILTETKPIEGTRVAEGLAMARQALPENWHDAAKGLVIPKGFVPESPSTSQPSDGTRGAVIPKQYVPQTPPTSSPSSGDKK